MAYIIAAIPLNKVYKKKENKYFIGNLDVTDCCENLTYLTTTLTLNHSKVNTLFLSKSINLTLDKLYLEFYITVPYNNIKINKLEEGLKQAQFEFSKLLITKKPKLMMFDSPY